MATPASRSNHTGSVRIIDHDNGLVFISQIADAFEIGNDAIHRKDTVGGDHCVTGTSVLRLDQRIFQGAHIIAFIAKALGLAKPNAVDDGRVIETI